MRKISVFFCLSGGILLGACATPRDGYYDANGGYHPYNNYNAQNHMRPPIPGGAYNYDDDYDDADDYHPVERTVTRTSSAPYNAGIDIPLGLLPPAGMCRVWFIGRVPENEPPLESCDGIKYRVPTGAYVIYGG